MTREIAGLVAVNVGYAVVGAALLCLLGSVTAELATWYRLGVAYPLGIVAVTVPASYVALAGAPVAITAAVVGGAVVVAAIVRRRAWRVRVRGRLRLRLSRGGAFAVALFLVLAVVLGYAARTFAIRPDIEWDSWAVWLAKARLLYADPSAAPAALRSGNYGQPPYPLGLPTLEALGFKAMGRYDSTVIALQFLFLACGFPLALWAILRTRARAWVVALVSIAIVAAPQMLYQLLTRYADVPLGLFVGLGIAAGAAWVVSREGWLLVCFAAFLGMAGVTKSEGFLFALAGCVALAASRERPWRGGVAKAIGAVLILILPWRIYCSVYGLTTPDYDLGHAVDLSYLRAHADRVGPTVSELWRQLVVTSSFGLLTWAILLALALGIAAARWRLLAFAGTWLALAAGGLILTYWISALPVSSHLTNTSYRTIVSLLIGGGAVVPLFVFPRREQEEEA